MVCSWLGRNSPVNTPSVPPVHIYVDYSGDEGFVFDGGPATDGSSRWIAVAPVIMSAADVDFNKSVLASAKAVIGCKQEDEVKWRTLRRLPARKLNRALRELSNLKMRLICLAIWKRAIKEEELRNTKTGALSLLLHQLWFNWLPAYFPRGQMPGITYYVDHFRKERDLLADFEQYLNENPEARKQYGAEFVDSKLVRLTQVADIYAGMLRDYLEGLEGKSLPQCEKCLSFKWGTCRYKRNAKLVGQANLVRHITGFLPRQRGEIWEHSLFIRPPEIRRRFYFWQCLGP